MRLVLNIPIAPEIEKNKKEKTEKLAYEKSIQSEINDAIETAETMNGEVATYSARVVSGNIYINVEGDVKITDFDEEYFPVRFGKVSGSFSCESSTNLYSLDGAPLFVGGNFSCRNCISLKSLEGSPKIVGGETLIAATAQS